MNKRSGFTIVELLVVIVVIGVLAAITIVSYSGVSSQANIASVKSDLGSSSRLLKMYYTDYGSYPVGNLATAFNASKCPTTPSVDTKYCLKLSGTNTIDYYQGTVNSFVLRIKNGTTVYKITNDTSPVAFVMPPNTTDNGDGTWTTVIYGDTSDGTVLDGNCMSSYSTEPTLDVQYTPDCDGANDPSERRSFLRFPTSSIEGVINSATINLYHVGASRSEDYIVDHINDYGTLNESDFNIAAYHNSIGTIVSSSVGYKNVNITTHVEEDRLSNRNSSYRVRLSTLSPYDYHGATFYSANNATNKPYLSVTWTP